MSQIPFDMNLMPERVVWSVSELAQNIREAIEPKFFNISVEGEISNLRPAQSGHVYFTLKDESAQIRCVCWREHARLLKFKLEDGISILARGSVNLYEQRGDLQFYVSSAAPAGAGALQFAFEQLKKKLEAEGLFDAARKRALPLLPRHVGLVTSPHGAALRDILHVMARRFPNLRITLYPVRVQGEGAAKEIIEGIEFFNQSKMVEVILLARGGGSLEDLQSFNEESVARAIHASVIPVITGVGHETDFTIADFVADMRAPTPSAAAELVVKQRQEFEQRIAEHARQIEQRLRILVLSKRQRVHALEKRPAFRRLETLIRSHRQRADELALHLSENLRERLRRARERQQVARARIESFDLRRHVQARRLRLARLPGELRAALERGVARKRRQLATAQMRVAAIDLRARTGALRRRSEQRSAELGHRMERYLAGQRRRVEGVAIQLRERSPFQILERGYSIAYDSEGRLLRSVEQVSSGQEIRVRVSDGNVNATVRDTERLKE